MVMGLQKSAQLWTAHTDPIAKSSSFHGQPPAEMVRINVVGTGDVGVSENGGP